MGMFKENKSKKVSPAMLEEYVMNTPDIFLITDYNGKIESANKEEIYELGSLENYFEKEKNLETYEDLINKTKENGSFSGEVFIEKGEIVSLFYVYSLNITLTKKLHFYIKDESSHFRKEKQLINENEKVHELLKSKDLFIANWCTFVIWM